MSGVLGLFVLLTIPFVAGCDCDCEDPVAVDSPPFPPNGVFSVTRDGLVEIYWNDNQEADLAGYAVYRSATELGPYNHLGDVGKNQTWYDDVVGSNNNGRTYYYAVAAFDRRDNLSELSYELVFDTPRPEGYNLVLVELGQNPALSGFDFWDDQIQSGTVQYWNAATTDIYFEYAGGVNYITTRTGVGIQDWGVIDMLEVDWAPSSGWLPSGRAEAAIGHSYVVRILGGGGVTNYAKFEVVDVNSTEVTLNWAYQVDGDNPELAPGQGGAAP